MSLLDVEALSALRTGPRSDAAEALAWLVGLGAVALGLRLGPRPRTLVGVDVFGAPTALAVGDWLGVAAGLVVAGVCLAVVATSVGRAVASGATFGLTLVVVGGLSWTVFGLEPTTGVRSASLGWLVSAAIVLGLPPTVAGAVRAVV